MWSRIEKVLKARKITVAQLSRGTGIPSTTIYSWKNGIVTPSAVRLGKIAEYLCVSVSYLMGETDDINEELTISAAENRLKESEDKFKDISLKIAELQVQSEEIQKRLANYEHILTIMQKIERLTPEQRDTIEALLNHLNKQ